VSSCFAVALSFRPAFPTFLLTFFPPPPARSYHNAGAENEHLGRLWEAQVSLERARALGARFLGSRSPTFNALNRSYRHFLARHPPAARPPAPAPRAHTHAAARGGKGGKDAKRRGAAARPGSGARAK
jgi:hypothetical protein